VRPTYSVELSCGGRALMYGVGPKHELRPKPHSAVPWGWDQGSWIFLTGEVWASLSKNGVGAVLPPPAKFFNVVIRKKFKSSYLDPDTNFLLQFSKHLLIYCLLFSRDPNLRPSFAQLTSALKTVQRLVIPSHQEVQSPPVPQEISVNSTP
jgi:hypothetical protein